jgi:hypothetical protein
VCFCDADCGDPKQSNAGLIWHPSATAIVAVKYLLASGADSLSAPRSTLRSTAITQPTELPIHERRRFEEWQLRLEKAIARSEFAYTPTPTAVWAKHAVRLFHLLKKRYEHITDPRELDARLKGFARWCADEVIERVWNREFAFHSFEDERYTRDSMSETVEKAAARFRFTLLTRHARMVNLLTLDSELLQNHSYTSYAPPMVEPKSQEEKAAPSASEIFKEGKFKTLADNQNIRIAPAVPRHDIPPPSMKGANVPQAPRRGRKRKFTPEQIAQATKMKTEKIPNREVAKVLYGSEAPSPGECRNVPKIVGYYASKNNVDE